MTAPSDPRGGPPREPARGDGAAPEHDGVDLQPDVERIHRAVAREPRDPTEGRERSPWFFTAAILLALFWGGWYLGRHGGEFSIATHIAYAVRDPGVARAAAEQVAEAVGDPVAAGRTVYDNNCQSCHQGAGQGVPGAFPPLVGAEWVTGDPTTLIRILLDGLQGPVEVAGEIYNGAMPAWEAVLRDAEIAAVATYVRQLGANDVGAVTAEQVAAVRGADQARMAPWTAPELRAAPPVEGPPAGGTPAPLDTISSPIPPVATPP